MQTAIRYVIGAWFVFQGIDSAAATRDASVAADPMAPRLAVDIAFESGRLSPGLEASVLREVARIWSAYGVDIGRLRQDDCGRDGAVRLSVAFASGVKRGVSDTTLGEIWFRDGVPQPAIVIHTAAVEMLVAATTLGSDALSSVTGFHDLVLGRALGRALAHEVGHYLLRSRLHSAEGLMRASQTALDLVEPDRRQFSLSPGEVAALRAGAFQSPAWSAD